MPHCGEQGTECRNGDDQGNRQSRRGLLRYGLARFELRPGLVDFARIDLLGILPTAETLLAQAAILAIIVAGYGWNRISAGKRKPAWTGR